MGENSIVENAAIFEKAKLDSFCKVHRSIVAEHAVLRSRVTLEGSVVGHGCILGKSAHLKNGRGVWPGITVEEGNIIEGKLALHMDELFHFYSSLGQYTGFSAKNIRDMINLTRKVGLKSIKFHLYRRDIECWIRDVCKANILAGMILDLRKDRLLGKKLVEELTRRLDDWLI